MGEKFRRPGVMNGIDDFVRLTVDAWDLKPTAVSIPDSVVARTGTIRESEPVPVRVMMPIKIFFETTIELEGVVTEWTNRAVRVHATMPDGRGTSAWVWANAVERIAPEPSTGSES